MSKILSKEDLLTLAGANASHALANEAQRSTALDYIDRHALPGLKDEAWLRTNLRPLLQHEYQVARPAQLSGDDIAPFRIEGLEANVLVFVNGYYAPALSQVLSPMHQLQLKSTAQARVDHPELLARYFERPEDSVFTALNTAFAADGTFIHVPRHSQVALPVHLLHVATTQQAALMQSRNLVVVEEDAQLQVIESHHSLGDSVYFHNIATSLHLHRGASLHYHLLQQLAPSAFQFNNLKVWQQADSELTTHTITLSGALLRNNLQVELSAPRAEAKLNGLYLPNGEQHVDNHLFVHHLAGDCPSSQFYRGVLDDAASAVFTGRILVARDAQHTNAAQSNKNILLTDTAKVSSKPQLEIYADDVACAHGCSTGQLNRDALFYMVQRGLSPEQARVFLLVAFVAEVLERITIGPLRAHLESIVATRLHG